jgi:hypothetical protein
MFSSEFIDTVRKLAFSEVMRCCAPCSWVACPRSVVLLGFCLVGLGWTKAMQQLQITREFILRVINKNENLAYGNRHAVASVVEIEVA